MAHVSVWSNKEGTVTLYLNGGGLTSNMSLNPQEAAQLVKDVTKALTKLPRVASAADLGLEAA